jgi:hypothetical protein
MKRRITVTWIVLFSLAVLLVSHRRAYAQGTAFTYQGRLNDQGSPANGRYDLRFAIYDAVTNGIQQGNTITNAATPVSNGVFTVVLNFGNQFPGADRWLEISVRANGAGPFALLSPRQALTATPYAVRAAGATTAVTVSGSFSGDVTNTQSATVVSAVGGVSAANVASGVNAANAATAANTPNTIVKRDGSGNFSAGTITANNISAPNLFGAIFMAGVVNPNNLTPFWTWLNGDSIQTANGPSLGPPMPVALTITSLILRVDALTAGANTVTVTLYKNGAATAMTATASVSTAGATVIASDTTHPVAVAVGDSLSIGYVQTNNVPIARIGVSTRAQ